MFIKIVSSRCTASKIVKKSPDVLQVKITKKAPNVLFVSLSNYKRWTTAGNYY